MRFSEETLMAYADGELDAQTRIAMEAAMQDDADLADAIALQIENRQALQTKLRAAFGGALSEKPPARLLQAVQAASTNAHPVAVSDLSVARQAKHSTARARWSAPQWGAIAASLLLGMLIGGVVLNRDDNPFAVERGRMTARADLNAALSSQPGGTINRDTGIQIGISYRAKNGDYCRTFTLKDAQVLAGFACRRNTQWTIDALMPTKADASGTYRMASATVPALILGLVEDTIAGDPLDAEQEAQARERSWEQ
jgi:hypothetical protein